MNIHKIFLLIISCGFMGISKPIDPTTRCYLFSMALGCLHGVTNQKLLSKLIPAKRPAHFFSTKPFVSVQELATGVLFLSANDLILSQVPGYDRSGVRRQCAVLHGVAQLLSEMASMSDDPKLNIALIFGSLGGAWDFLTKS